ncbi:hypothetical protein RRV45_01160 [Bacillus sp. DTU_2020_1000418_1_SI_GHA_SEK_038]|uniref:hypothetical protein n=1 Tax=Bacillus sp. DTU_2020_1000418_1_SI_GHA_SEK_038 TaxID=3077585 RepID=UPI0028EE6363|nr:hypothetical protein [Bacillus sp. DTU_2020_1000418_1_SI_GHA_SEK_038]WNS75688.1 hypothetical protein RRV45_01160 [Bacillus sp. DTU_2020_1000418_1_SI_GHA_SEK_038]
MNNSRYKRLQDLEEELRIIRSLYDRFWTEMSQQQQDYLGNIEHKIVKEIRILEEH